MIVFVRKVKIIKNGFYSLSYYILCNFSYIWRHKCNMELTKLKIIHIFGLIYMYTGINRVIVQGVFLQYIDYWYTGFWCSNFNVLYLSENKYPLQCMVFFFVVFLTICQHLLHILFKSAIFQCSFPYCMCANCILHP